MGPKQSPPKDSVVLGLEKVENEILPAKSGRKEKRRNKESSTVTDRQKGKERQADQKPCAYQNTLMRTIWQNELNCLPPVSPPFQIILHSISDCSFEDFS